MKLSLLQWNIWYKEDPANVVKLLKQKRPDIFCLQELTIGTEYHDKKDIPAHIAKELGYDYHYKELPIETPDGKTEIWANGIFSRLPIVGKSFTWINQPKDKGGYDDEYRVYVEVELAVEDKSLFIGTTHMSYTHRFEPTKNKRAETDALIRRIRRHTKRLVFTGDLNAAPGSYTINQLESHFKNAGPDYSQKTWTTKPFAYNGFEETELNWRLDYIFATNDIQVVSSSVADTHYSDHLPLLVEFVLA